MEYLAFAAEQYSLGNFACSFLPDFFEPRGNVPRISCYGDETEDEVSDSSASFSSDPQEPISDSQDSSGSANSAAKLISNNTLDSPLSSSSENLLSVPQGKEEEYEIPDLSQSPDVTEPNRCTKVWSKGTKKELIGQRCPEMAKKDGLCMTHFKSLQSLACKRKLRQEREQGLRAPPVKKSKPSGVNLHVFFCSHVDAGCACKHDTGKKEYEIDRIWGWFPQGRVMPNPSGTGTMKTELSMVGVGFTGFSREHDLVVPLSQVNAKILLKQFHTKFTNPSGLRYKSFIVSLDNQITVLYATGKHKTL